MYSTTHRLPMRRISKTLSRLQQPKEVNVVKYITHTFTYSYMHVHKRSVDMDADGVVVLLAVY